LAAAAARTFTAEAAVACGGRPDLAGEFLRLVCQPTLLIVGWHDATVIELDRNAAQLLPGESLEIVPGAAHLFEERGALEQVARLARDWFLRHLKLYTPRRSARHATGGRRNG
jgi:pimeloyl-ACP methyl ester carboxylesterase